MSFAFASAELVEGGFCKMQVSTFVSTLVASVKFSAYQVLSFSGWHSVVSC